MTLFIRGIEVTQAIQYYRADQHLTFADDRGPDNSLQLVANKAAWARVYVEADAPGSIANVTGTLDVGYGVFNTRAGSPGVTLMPESPGAVTAYFNPDYPTMRASKAMTLDFVIPPDRMFGPLVLTAQVHDAGNSQADSHVISVVPTLRQTLRVRGIMIGYDGPDPANPAQTMTLAAPGIGDLQTTAAWALRVMPVQGDAVFEVASTLTRTVPLSGMATNGSCTTAWGDLNSAIAAAKTADGNHPGFLYYGLIAEDFPNTSNVGGCESSGVSSGPNGSQVAFAHEIGHACGRAHAPCGGVGTSADASYPAYEPYDTPAARVASIGEYGLDITTGDVPTPATAHDYMSYCGPPWISIYGHHAFTNNAALNPEQVGRIEPWWWHNYVAYDRWWWLHYIPDPPPYWVDPESIRELPIRVFNVISIIGLLYSDGRVEVTSVARTGVMAVDLDGVETGLRAVIQDEDGAELAAAPVIALSTRGSCGCGGCGSDPGPTLFQAFLEDVAEGSSLSIRRESEAVWERSAPRSKLSVVTPKVRATDAGVEVVWRATGETDTWVRVSADRGQTWRAAATEAAEQRAVIDAEQLPAGPLLVEVVVHDGFRSVRSKAAKFTNATLPPVPAILHPHPVARLVAGRTLYLWGSVAEQPGRSRDDFRYEWTLDGDPIGTGLHVFGRVPEAGRHRCELTVHDARGKGMRACSLEFTSVPAPTPSNDA
jgi:hypothetical protein